MRAFMLSLFPNNREGFFSHQGRNFPSPKPYPVTLPLFRTHLPCTCLPRPQNDSPIARRASRGTCI